MSLDNLHRRHEHLYKICYFNSDTSCKWFSAREIKPISEYCQVSIHYIVSFTHEAYGNATSISNIMSKFRTPYYKLSDTFPVRPQDGDDDVVDPNQRANATFVILCRNSDLNGAVRSIRDIEDRFNRKYRYPYVFLNEEPFTEEFKECVLVPSCHK